MRAHALLDAATAPADSVRRAWLRAVAPLARRAVVDRDTRVSVGGALGVASSLLLTVVAPIWMLVLGPLVWGVPHLVADVRYLVARPGLHRRPAVWLFAGVPVALAALTPLGVRAGLAGAIGALLVARGVARPRRVAGLVVCAALLALACRAPYTADLTFAHAHNFIAVAFFWAWRPARRWLHALPVALFALSVALLLAGAFDAVVEAAGGWSAPRAGVPLGYFLLALAPFPSQLELARRLLLVFTFAQAVHYVVWLRLIPDEARPSPTPRSFRQSARALTRDLGVALPLLAGAVALGLLAWAFSDPGAARDGYLRLAVFHGHLELAAAALLWAERRRP